MNLLDFTMACNEFGHKWTARFVAKLVQGSKFVGTVGHGLDGYTVSCFPYSQKTGLTLVQLRDIMRDVRDGKPLAEIFGV